MNRKPGHANLPIGESTHVETDRRADAEIGVPGQADLEIGVPAWAIREKGVPGTVDRVGSPGGGPGWHSRGYLPHFDGAGFMQHVTFHLADSVPKEALTRIEAELRSLPKHRQTVEKHKRVEAWLDAGYGSCILGEPDVAAMVQGALLFFHGQRCRLSAWVVMPNHVHVLFEPLGGWTVAKIVASWKKFTATKIRARNAILPNGEGGDANREIGVAGLANAEIGVPGWANTEVGVPVWHREYWDRYMRDEDHFRQTVEYIHQNPVKAGLVARAEAWRWSSAWPDNANRLSGA